MGITSRIGYPAGDERRKVNAMSNTLTKLDAICETAHNLSKHRGIVWVMQDGPESFRIDSDSIPRGKGVVVAQYEFGKFGTMLECEP